VVTCCGANLDYLLKTAPDSTRSRLKLIHHGVDLELFRPAEDTGPDAGVPLIVSAGRLVEKKGFPDLLMAIYLLKQAGIPFRCEIHGGGPLQLELTARIIQLGLQDEVVLAGEYAQDQIIPVLQSASLFALTPSVAEDGDRDGIPNVLVEAMACGLPVVSTSVAGIPELVVHGNNGLLFEPHDSEGISAGLAALLEDPALRARLGRGARQTVEDCYDQRSASVQLAELFADNQGER
jgi:glycosyltransferase involved in cell wall biosynthesis